MGEVTVSPYLTVNNANGAIDWYERVLNAKCTFKLPAEDGKRLMHATLVIRDCPLMLSDEFPEFGGFSGPDLERGSPVAVSVSLEKAADVDRTFALALAEGGRESHPPEDMFWGDRFAQFYDPFGHRWMIRAPLEDA